MKFHLVQKKKFNLYNKIKFGYFKRQNLSEFLLSRRHDVTWIILPKDSELNSNE